MKNKIIILFAVAGMSFTVASCRNSRTESAEKTVNDSVLTSLPRTSVHTEEVCRELKLNGHIVPDEAHQSSVYALVSGRIGSISVEVGDRVRKGQTLAVLKSAEVADVNNELTLARSNLEIANKNYEAYKELYESNLVSERDYIAARVEYEKARSELQKAENVSAITGGENSLYKLVSPLDGYIVAKHITGNSEVHADMADPIFSIADLSVVWILVDVFEVDITDIELEQAVSVNTISNPDVIYEGKIDKIYNVLDPETRTMKARVSLVNNGNSLMPGMFVSVRVKIKNDLQAVATPSKSLVFDNNNTYVIVMKDNKSPEIRPVNIIFRSGDKCYVEGLSDGETVITGSQIFLFESLKQRM